MVPPDFCGLRHGGGAPYPARTAAVTAAAEQRQFPTPRAGGWLNRRRIRTLLAGWGIVAAALTVVYLESRVPDQARLMEHRQLGVERSLASLDVGAPPLLGVAGLERGQTVDLPTLAGRSYYEVSVGDSPGIYLYLPVVGHALGIEDGRLLIKWFFILLYALIPLVYPLLFYELLGSLPAALLSPMLGVFGFQFLQNIDVYWAYAWILLLCLPLLLLIHQRWGRRSWLWVGLVCLLASFGSSIRLNSGIAVVVCAAVVVLSNERRFRRRVAQLGVVLSAYLAVVPLGFGVATAISRSRADAPVAPASRYTIFHSAYIGLGYVDNPYGIRYDDSVAFLHGKKRKPDLVYLGPDYKRTLRSLYFETIREHPGFFATNVAAKIQKIAKFALERFWLLLLLVPPMLLVGRHRDEIRRHLLIISPAIVIGALPPVAVIPIEEYSMGWLGAWGVIWLLSILWVVRYAGEFGAAAWRTFRGKDRQSVETGLRNFLGRWAQQRPSGAARSVGRLLRSRWAAWPAVVIAALVTVALLPQPIGVARAALYGAAHELAPPPPADAVRVAEWAFAGRVPSGWRAETGVFARPAGRGLSVDTTALPNGYQLSSGVRRLPAGTYTLYLDGRVTDGGLLLGALDVAAQAWKNTAGHAAGQEEFDAKRMNLTFVLDRPTDIELILANWAPKPRSSRWELRHAELVKGAPK